MTEIIRINKYLATHAGLSRRGADDAIAQGKVQINGIRAALGNSVHPDDVVLLEGKKIEPRPTHTVIALNKPVGYVCSRKQQGESPTVYSLLPAEYHSLKLVGRLDRDSSGIILLTSDGDLAHSLTHPSFHKQKIYEVALDTALQPLHRQMISDFGVSLEDGKSKFELERLEEGDDTRWRITMSEGRNRQIRRTFASLGYTVTALHRTQFGPYTLGNLPTGKFEAIKNLP